LFRKLFLVSGIVLLFVTACSAPSQSNQSGGDTPGAPSSDTAFSKDFLAQNNPDGRVDLTWKAISGVDSYLVELQIGGNEFIQLASLTADQTKFTDVNPPMDSSLIYRLSAVTKSKTSETQMATVVTPAEKSNPIKISVDFDKSAPEIDPKNLDLKNLDLSKIDPNNFDPSKFIPQPVQTQSVVGPKGGVLSATGLNNVVYTLTIPANSLTFDTSIMIKPVSNIPDLPLSKGLIGAVVIEPQDTVFRIPATLTITPPKSSPVSNGSLKAGFAFNTDGQEFHLFPTERNIQANLGVHLARLTNKPSLDETPEDKLKVPYGGGYGTGNGTPADIQKISASNPTNAVDSTDQALALAQLEDDLAPLPNISKASAILAKTGEQIFQQANKANDWNKFMETLDKLSTYMNSEGGKFNKSLNEKIIASLVDKANKLLQKSKSDCLSEDDLKSQELLERLVNPKDDFSKTFSSQFKNKFGEKSINDLYNGMKSCTYQVQMKSNLSYDVESSVLFTSMETQKIPLYFVYVKGQVFLYGSGPMKFNTSVSGTCSFPIEHYDGLTLVFQKLSVIFDKGNVSDFAVEHLFVDGWTQGVSIQSSSSGDCPTMVKLTGGGDYWTGLFTVARVTLKNEMMMGWKIQQGDFAKGTPLKANWQSVVKSFPPMGSKGLLSEDTKLELVIMPNKK
jgi:hypothetical protein